MCAGEKVRAVFDNYAEAERYGRENYLYGCKVESVSEPQLLADPAMKLREELYPTHEIGLGNVHVLSSTIVPPGCMIAIGDNRVFVVNVGDEK